LPIISSPEFVLTVKQRREPAPDVALAVPVRRGAVPARWESAAAVEGFVGEAESACEILGGAQRVLLVGVGRDPDGLALEAAGALAASRWLRVAHVAVDLRGWTKHEACAWLTGMELRAWRYESLRTTPAEDAPTLACVDAVTDSAGFAKAWARRQAVLTAVRFARDLVTEPSNTLTPAGFVAQLEILRAAGVTVEVLEGAALVDVPLSGLIAVGQGSVHAPRLAVLRWAGTHEAPPVAFVGKGITFDTGGICIKPADHMWDMRADMAGAAACAGAMLALALRQSPAPAMAVLALAENAISGSAYRPGDVLTHANGTTIEVVDTDAEGRLVLMDALGWAAAQKPAAIIDLATLTGCVVTALGHEMAGMFDNDAGLAAAVAASGAAVGERVWRLPIDDSHRRELDSEIADLRHCSPDRGQPDACQAAAFLREFVDETPWVHLDIAGTENHEKADDRFAAGATGFGVRLLDRLVFDRYEDPHRV
jgi:leucyl aminopeptidase